MFVSWNGVGVKVARYRRPHPIDHALKHFGSRATARKVFLLNSNTKPTLSKTVEVELVLDMFGCCRENALHNVPTAGDKAARSKMWGKVRP
jgi:hypothetical protein